jgi:hypothetical protein
MRGRRVLTAVGEVGLWRTGYLCPHYHNGQCPADAGLDIEKTDSSPGVRRVLALLGSERPFDHGRRQIELLACLEVTAKAVEGDSKALFDRRVSRRWSGQGLEIRVYLTVPPMKRG